MEVKMNIGDSINIPEDCKAVIKDNKVVFEELQGVFKDGDILIGTYTKCILIFREYVSPSKATFYSYYNTLGVGNSNWAADLFRLVTNSEKQAFYKELAEKGLHWDAEAKKMERYRKRVATGNSYLLIDINGKVCESFDLASNFDNSNFSCGNYYLPSERKQAEKDAEAIKVIFRRRLEV